MPHPRYLLTLVLVVALGLIGCDQATLPTASPSDEQDPANEHLVAHPASIDVEDALPDAAASKGDGDIIPGHYIVVFRDEVDRTRASAALSDVRAMRGVAVRHVYDAVLNGFAAELSDEALKQLLADPRVAYVEPDRVMQATATQSNPTWGLDRIDERSLPLDRKYVYGRDGNPVRVYVIDTGIYTGHSQFGGRAINVYDAFGGNGQDCNGHGTHVAGTVGANSYGVAKRSKLRGVRVLGCNGSGSTSGIIAAVNWVRGNAIKPAVANMSLGGGKSSSLNTAVNNLANSGIFVAVAAGNENQNACNVSPASAGRAYTTAASTSSDYKASFSNYGSCVDGYAPGQSITSTWTGGGTRTINGTSMASPHVAGVAALLKHRYGERSSTWITNWINNNASTGKIRGNRSGTPNRLLYMRGL